MFIGSSHFCAKNDQVELFDTFIAKKKKEGEKNNLTLTPNEHVSSEEN